MSNSQSNGIIRIGRKGKKKFAFGDDGPVFEIDVVEAFQQWLSVHESFLSEEDAEGNQTITDREGYHNAALQFVAGLGGGEVTRAEALDFLARLREQYDELATFFRPKLRDEPELQDTSEPALQFSEEPAP